MAQMVRALHIVRPGLGFNSTPLPRMSDDDFVICEPAEMLP